MGRKWRLGANQTRRFVTKLIGRDGSKCVWCQRDTRRSQEPVPDQQTIDHVIPFSHGGEAHIANYMLACRQCNEDRGNRSVDEYLAWAINPNRSVVEAAQQRATQHDWLT